MADNSRSKPIATKKKKKKKNNSDSNKTYGHHPQWKQKKTSDKTKVRVTLKIPARHTSKCRGHKTHEKMERLSHTEGIEET